jgi:hypothetical protein
VNEELRTGARQKRRGPQKVSHPTAAAPILASLVVDADRNLDFEAGQAAIRRIAAEDIEHPELFDDDPATASGIESIRRTLATELDALRLGLHHSPEVGWIEVRGAIVYLTASTNGGQPTELIATIDLLRAARGVLRAVGFERES